MDIDIVIVAYYLHSNLDHGSLVSGGIFRLFHLTDTWNYQNIALVLGSVATALFGPAKKWIEVLVDKFIFKDRYDYSQIIHSLHTSLNTLDDSTEIARVVVGLIVQTLNLAGACLFIKSQSGDYMAGAAQGSFADRNKQNQLLALIYRKDHSSQFPKTASSADPEISMLSLAGDNEVSLCLYKKLHAGNFSSRFYYRSGFSRRYGVTGLCLAMM
jgi:hypothetical protein